MRCWKGLSADVLRREADTLSLNDGKVSTIGQRMTKITKNERRSDQR